jgi:hypothetical protein
VEVWGNTALLTSGPFTAVAVLHISVTVNVCNGRYGSGLTVRFDLVAVAFVIERTADGQLIPNITDRAVERRYVGVGG